MAEKRPGTFRYRGYYYDTETGFYYLQTRYYDPEIRRFINADNYALLPELAGALGQLNLYTYCNNNPVMYTDSTGEIAIELIWGGIALLSMLGIIQIEVSFHPIETTLNMIADGISYLGNGMRWLGNEIGYWFLNAWEPGTWPGDDPTISPGEGFEWRGPGEVGSEFGEWYNPLTGDQLHPDLNHPFPKGPHWGWRNKLLKIIRDIFKTNPPWPPTFA